MQISIPIIIVFVLCSQILRSAILKITGIPGSLRECGFFILDDASVKKPYYMVGYFNNTWIMG